LTRRSSSSLSSGPARARTSLPTGCSTSSTSSATG
jgi:hypothetical protein